MTQRKVYLPNKKAVLLPADSFIAQGGEGSVYRLDHKTVAKLLHKPKEWQKHSGHKKIQELSGFHAPEAAMPKELLFDSRSSPIGFTAEFVEGDPLVRFFTTTLWRKSGFDYRHALFVTEQLRDLYNRVHNKGWLVADGNEYNLLLHKEQGKFHLKAIDTDSWYLPGFAQPVVMMPSIVDYRHHSLGEGSDWYAFAVVTFQLFTGIHPFRGNVPGFKQNQLKERVMRGVSVFHNGVKMPKAVRPINNIPAPLRDWYRDVFEGGARFAPPGNLGKIVKQGLVTTSMVAGTSGSLELSRYNLPSNISRIYPAGAVLLGDGKLVTISGDYITMTKSEPIAVIKSQKAWLVATKQNELLYCKDGYCRQLDNVSVARFVTFGDELFAINGRTLCSVEVVDIAGKHFVRLNPVVDVSLQSTKWFDGVGIMEMLDARFVVAMLGSKLPQTLRVQELDGTRIIDARGFKKSIAFMYERHGKLWNAYLTPRSNGGYRWRETEVDVPILIVTEHPAGFLVLVQKDGELLLLDPASGNERKLPHRAIGTNAELVLIGKKMHIFIAGELYELSTK